MALCASISAPKGFANIIPPLPTTAQVEKLYIDGRSCCGNALLCSQGGVRGCQKGGLLSPVQEG